MRLYADLRCLQASSQPHHSAGLLRHARRWLPNLVEVVGLLDPALPPLPDPPTGLVNRWQSGTTVWTTPHQAVFFQPAIFGPDPTWLSPIFAHAEIIGCIFLSRRSADEPRLELWSRVFRELYPVIVEDTWPAQEEELAAQQLWSKVARAIPAPPRRRSSRPRVAVVGPYPPEPTGVAEVTGWLTQGLVQYASVDVYTNTTAPRPDLGIGQILPLADRPYTTGEYDRVLTILDNNPNHLPVYDLYRKHGGACLLHDADLAELVVWRNGQEGAARLAEQTLGREIEARELARWLHDPANIPTTFCHEIVDRTAPLFVRSPLTRDRVRAEHGGDVIALPSGCSRLFHQRELSEAGRAAARQRLGLSPERLVLISLGLVHPVRLPLECLWTVEQLGAWANAVGMETELHFVGSSDFMKPFLLPWLDRLHLANNVFFPGVVSENVYRDYLRAADVGLVLRAGCPGSLSEALLDCIAAGLPTITGTTLARSVEAPSYVYALEDRFSPVLVAERIVQLVQEGRHRHRVCVERNQYLAAHTPGRCAGVLLRALEAA